MKRILKTLTALLICNAAVAQTIPHVTGPLSNTAPTIHLTQKTQSIEMLSSQSTQRGGIGCIDPTLINPNAICPAIWAPVCGCNNVTYANECEAINYGGVTSWTPGECIANGCIDDSQIDLSVGCPLIWMPVCGCNGVTYGNDCEAYYYGGVTSWTPGECGVSGCGAYYYYDNQGFNVSFFNASFGDYNNVLYDFGDGTTSTEFNPEHTYTNYGTYEVCITITGTDCNDTYCDFVIVEPLCSAFYFYDNNCNNTITFKNYSQAVNATYTWNFGDGSMAVNNNEIFDHSYPATGIYYACVNVNGDECTTTFCDTVYVYNEATLPGYNQTFTPTQLPVTVSFQSGTLLPFPFSYTWDFGDGEYGYEPNVVHTFTNTCSPTVCLMVDAGMCSKETCKTLDLCTTGLVSIKEHAVIVFPNPFTDFINVKLPIQSDAAFIEVFDITGKLLIETSNAGQQQVVIDTEALSKGIYLIKVRQGENVTYHRLVK